MKMDAEIRRLTYVPRFGGSKPLSGAPAGIGSIIGDLPALFRKDEVAKHATKSADLRLEARLIELERERAESERRHREALDDAHQKAVEERAVALSEQKERLDQEHASAIQASIAAFQEAQRRYFADAEAAVVRLSLSIAGRVLHREAQMDPLLLRGAVRVALEDMQQSATCVLEVAAEKAEAWGRWLSGAGMLARIQIRSKEDAAPGHCRLEIGASTADLSVNTQLAEIERGFFDLLQSRPAGGDGEAESER
jgi:flagellar assembly protein FliH